MTPYKRGDYYYIDLQLSDGRRLVRSTRETSKRRAQAIEATVREMDGQGETRIMDALVEGEISPRQLHAAKLGDRVDELLADADNPPLEQAIRTYLNHETYYGAKWSMDSLRDVAPDNARLSWCRDVDNLRELVRYYREEDYAAGTERRQMAYISKFLTHHFNQAIRDELWGGLNLRDEDNRRCAWLGVEEMRAIQEIASDRMWALISTLASTGIRLGEALDLRRRDVDTDQGWILIRKGKSDSARRKVPITGKPLETLKTWMRGVKRPRAKLWPELTNNAAWHRWDRYRKHLELKTDEDEWFRLHDFRHHYAVHMAKAGVPLTELRDLLGHSSLRMVERYAIYTPPPARDRLERAYRQMGFAAPDATEPQHSDQQPGQDGREVGT